MNPVFRRLLAACLMLVVLPLALAADPSRNLSLAPAAVEKRVALVIGNASYKDAPLRNPVNDASDVAAALKQLGFSVSLKTNVGQKDMRAAIREFSQSLKRGGVGLFYFAGHGVQSKGRNFLIPISADIREEFELEDEAVDANRVLAGMEEAGNRVNIVILDACRNNPFGRSWRSTAGGLAQMNSPAGSFVAFATAPGSVAADGSGRNGLFTEHLLDSLRQPDSDIDRVFTRVTAAVARSTGNKQVPWKSSSLTAEFRFRDSDALTSGAPPRPGPTVTSAARQSLASLVVTSRLAQAEVWLDGKAIGELRSGNELVVDQLDAGRHQLLVRKDRHSWQRSVELGANSRSAVQLGQDVSLFGGDERLVAEVLASTQKNYYAQADAGAMFKGALRELARTTLKGKLSLAQGADGLLLDVLPAEGAPFQLAMAQPGNFAELQRELLFVGGLARELGSPRGRTEEALLRGALGGLDSASDLLTPQAFDDMRVGMVGSFGGIGLELALKEGWPVVVAPLDGAPGARAGLLARDRIVSVEGNSTQDLPLAEVVKLLRGNPGSQVVLEVRREGWQGARSFTLGRELIRLEAVTSRELEPGIGLLAIKQFNNLTAEKLRQTLDKWRAGTVNGAPLSGLILDLRNNPGGMLDVVMEVAGVFLPDGQLVAKSESRVEQFRNGFRAKSSVRPWTLPLVVLVNEGSASGSELLAGSLQDLKRALVVGNRTFGKGTVQSIFKLEQGYGLKLTSGEYRLPSGRAFNGTGIEPDQLLTSPGNKDAPGPDLQLQAALASLKSVMAGP